MILRYVCVSLVQTINISVNVTLPRRTKGDIDHRRSALSNNAQTVNVIVVRFIRGPRKSAT